MISHPSIRNLPWMDWTQLRCELTWIYDDMVGTGHHLRREFSPGQAAFLIRKGRVTIVTEQGQADAEAGEWIFLNEGKRVQHFEDQSHIISIRFHCAWPGHRPLFDWPVAHTLKAERFPELERFAADLSRVCSIHLPSARLHLAKAELDAALYLQLHDLFLRWLSCYVRTLTDDGCQPSHYGLGDERILRAIRSIDFHPLEKPFRETVLAKEVNLSPSQLGKRFMHEVGMSPCRYYERRRLDEAIVRIRNTATPLKEIAADLGFSSLPHFSAWFRQKASMSPNTFRHSLET